MQYPASISAEELSQLESVDFGGPIVVVSDVDEDFAEAMDYLKGQTVIGFDTETKPCFTSNSPRHHVALLQLSGADKAYIFRLNLLGLPAPLASVLSDDRIVKVGAAVKEDVRGLYYYRKFTPRSFVDLQTIVAEYGITDKSVRKMSAIILGKKVSKTQQLSNWEAPQLSGAQLKYAAIDAWVCREMYLRLKSEGGK
ncbi:MAG TPA: 3'-5' exonuclease domain-containing protein 2 [Candidatus Coprenecus stercoravium]|uniref:3'-5' exonuclease n=1 Tax=Candidatus Coprenecus stercoravium TaxID=2840735 RepID=A0A9D2GQ56_9BACT|nr:3'-5' exonuclease domain-containing protein 2 [Candidatus Coprenecus stercoravium]